MEISDREFHRLVDYMHDNFGINLSSKRVLIQGRLGNMLRERGFTSYDQYLDAVMADTSGAEVTTILNKLTTNHTFFMREPEHYTYLKEVILPWAVANAKNHELRIWSAGCSTRRGSVEERSNESLSAPRELPGLPRKRDRVCSFSTALAAFEGEHHT